MDDIAQIVAGAMSSMPNTPSDNYQFFVISKLEKATSVPFRLTSMPTVPVLNELSLTFPTTFPFTVKVKALLLAKILNVLMLLDA